MKRQAIKKMLAKDFFGGNTLLIKKELDELVGQLQVVNTDFQGIVREFVGRFEFVDMKQLNEYMQAITMIANNTRIWGNRGHTPHELAQMGRHHLMQLQDTPFNVIDGGKTGRNEPCHCGSGKKHKKCCGK